MRNVTYTDKNGYLRRSMIPDSDPDEAAEFGLPSGPPSLNDIDWEWLKREMNNALVREGLFTWDDIQRSGIGVQVATNILKRALIGLYREKDKAEKGNQ